MADQPSNDQQSQVQIGNKASGAADILHRALQEAATECFESSSEVSNLERPTSDSPAAINANLISEELKLTPPVGSSSNPIQIIQQGNTYHSTQSLSQEQLQQIAQVLQQQQLVQANQKGGTSVLYNPVTNTRVVYRVIYPAQLQAKRTNSLSSSEKTAGTSRGRGKSRVKKACGRRSPEEEEDEEKVEGSGPELSREEKEERKKHRPRTRSGRISKPPSYMVKDYKRIHHLDFDEEPYDDSDGGYSDFNVSGESDNEEDMNSEDSKSRRLPAGVTTARRRNFKCCTCEKAYIGRGGLTRHYRLNPGHVNPVGHESDDHSNATIHSADDSNLMAHSLDDAASEPKTDTAVTSKNEDINIQLSPSLVEAVPVSLVADSEKVSIDQQYKRKESNCYQRRMDPAYRKTRLKGVISQCSDEELLEVVMPRLAKAVSAWEFLLMKCDREPNVDIAKMYSELENVLKHATKVAHSQLVKPGSQLCSEHLNVTDDRVAKALELSVGTYGIKHSEPVEFCLRLPKPHQTDTITTESTSTTGPSEKRRRIDDSAQTFSLLEDVGCETNYFLEPKETAVDSEPSDAIIISEASNDANVIGTSQQTDVVVIGEPSNCVNGIQYYSLDPQTSSLFERKEPCDEETGDNFTTAQLEKPTFTQVYSVQVETEEDQCHTGAVQGNVSSQEMAEGDQMDAVDCSETSAFSSVQEVEFACGTDPEITRLHRKEENENATDNDVQLEKHTFAQLCTMQVGNGNGHFLCDVSGIIFPTNVSQEMQEQVADLAGETVEFSCRKDSSPDLGLDRESCTIDKEENVEVRHEEDNVAQLEVHTFEHDVCTMEVENEDGDIVLGDDACILPTNAVMVSSLSNSECEMTTYQIPDAEVPIETVQALLAMNDASASNR